MCFFKDHSTLFSYHVVYAFFKLRPQLGKQIVTHGATKMMHESKNAPSGGEARALKWNHS